jgi:hypothetical protein
MDIEVKKLHKLLTILQKNKKIELNKQYYTTEWSWYPMSDGRFVYEETIREHAVIQGVDCYFTNANNRIYFKEDLYENKEDAEEMCKWQNGLKGYDYDDKLSRERYIKQFITFEAYHWKYKDN